MLRPTGLGSPFSLVWFLKELSQNTRIFRIFARKRTGLSLQFRLRGGEEEIEPSVQLSSVATTEKHREVKSGSQSLRFLIANNSLIQVCKVGPVLESWRKPAIECLIVRQSRFLRSIFQRSYRKIRAISFVSWTIR